MVSSKICNGANTFPMFIYTKQTTQASEYQQIIETNKELQTHEQYKHKWEYSESSTNTSGSSGSSSSGSSGSSSSGWFIKWK